MFKFVGKKCMELLARPKTIALLLLFIKLLLTFFSEAPFRMPFENTEMVLFTFFCIFL